MARKSEQGKHVSAALIAAMDEELKEITKRHPAGHDKAGEFVYGALDRMRIIDRACKIDALKMKGDSTEFGTAFKKDDS